MAPSGGIVAMTWDCVHNALFYGAWLLQSSMLFYRITWRKFISCNHSCIDARHPNPCSSNCFPDNRESVTLISHADRTLLSIWFHPLKLDCWSFPLMPTCWLQNGWLGWPFSATFSTIKMVLNFDGHDWHASVHCVLWVVCHQNLLC